MIKIDRASIFNGHDYTDVVVMSISGRSTINHNPSTQTKENRQIKGSINKLGEINYPNDNVQRKEGDYQELTRVYEGDAVLTEELKISDGHDKTEMDSADERALQQTLLMKESGQNNQKFSTFKGTNIEATRGEKKDRIFCSQFYPFLVPTDLQSAILQMQTQLQSLADQMQHYNRNKSLMGKGLTSPPGQTLLERFDDIDPEMMIGEFNKLHQTSSVSQYIERFEELKSYMLIFNKDFPEEYFTASFISGLRDDIKGSVMTLKPTSFTQAISLAKK
ncbi:hypothetical protein BUALT_Bualt05G0065400 [Buddleja alternifolia]|uniref:Retrotransposon gag domain-containing protein n=1 Tax=Buddleja alternifolia TaxID=168488 RepID=A0AAV6XQK7_9LAMI|nr:hypothetical protein BUALT_Bualt05G0065400 [Buddleja alternifolia]